MTRGDSGGEADWAKGVSYLANQGEHTYSLTAAFEIPDADETTIQMIASTFLVND
jgi:hypothetical protein